MNCKIIRGKDQIGGTITEITSASGTKIWVDFGAELSVKSENSSDGKMIELLKTSKTDAILFTHIHGDHTGLLYAVPSDVEVYMGAMARELLVNIRETLVGIPNYDSQKKEKSKRELEILKSRQTKIYEDKKRFCIKDIAVTPYLVDHSAPDAYMFRIEADGKSIVHTGDFRNHGRLGVNLLSDIKVGIAKESVDILVIEGTMMSRGKETRLTEDQLQKKAKKELLKNPHVFLICSSTNMESLASFYWATIFSGKERSRREGREYKPAFICNSYIKKQLEVYANRVGKDDWWFCFHRSYEIQDSLKADIYGKTQKQRMIDDGFTMVVGTSEYYQELMRKFKDLNPKPIVFYSMWKGYLTAGKEYTNQALIDMREEWKDSWIPLHTSGHIMTKDLSEVISAISPREQIIPIHTEEPKGFMRLDIPEELKRKIHGNQFWEDSVYSEAIFLPRHYAVSEKQPL